MKKAQLSTNQIEGLNENILSHILVGVLVVTNKLVVTAVNPVYCKIIGIDSKKSISNTKLQSHGLRTKAPVLFKAIQGVLKTGKTSILKETPHKHDAQTRFLDARISPLKDNSGHVIGAVVSVQDITEIVDLKTMIQYLRDYSDRIIDSSPAGILVTDTMGIITKINKAHERISGRTKEEILGRVLYKNYAPNTSQSARDGFQEVVTTGKTRSFRYQMYPSSRKGIQHFHIRLGPLKDERDQIIGVVQVIDDVTKEVKLQRESQQHAKSLEEKIKELNTSYIEVGKVNRQLASLIDIEKLIPAEKDSLSNIQQIIESVTVILGGEFSILRIKEHNKFKFSLIHGKNKLVSLSPKSLDSLNELFSLLKKHKLPFQIYELSKKESETLQLNNIEQPIVSMSLLPISEQHEQDARSILMCFSKQMDFSNLDIELGKTFMKRIKYLLGAVQKPTTILK